MVGDDVGDVDVSTVPGGGISKDFSGKGLCVGVSHGCSKTGGRLIDGGDLEVGRVT